MDSNKVNVKEQYFQRRRINIAIDPLAYQEIQRFRSLYILSGKTVMEIPPMTEFINGMVVFLYFQLKSDYSRQLVGKEDFVALPIVKKNFNNLEIEKEFSQEEYENFISILPQENFKTEIENKDDRQKVIYRMEYNRLPQYEVQAFNMILNEEMVIWARKINKLLNDINQKRVIYSLPDMVKTTIKTVVLSELRSVYVNDVYLAHLYNIDPTEYFEFYYGSLSGLHEEILDNPKYRNLISILADRPIVYGLDKISDKLFDLQELSTYRINRLLREIDKAMDIDKLWSYVGNFNYKKAMRGNGLFNLALYSNLDMSDFSDLLYRGELFNYFKDVKPPYNNPNYQLAESYGFFLRMLSRFMDTVYVYNAGISNL